MTELEETFPLYIARLELDFPGTGRVSLEVEVANAGGPDAGFYELSHVRWSKKAREPISPMEIFNVRLHGHVLNSSPLPADLY